MSHSSSSATKVGLPYHRIPITNCLGSQSSNMGWAILHGLIMSRPSSYISNVGSLHHQVANINCSYSSSSNVGHLDSRNPTMSHGGPPSYNMVASSFFWHHSITSSLLLFTWGKSSLIPSNVWVFSSISKLIVSF